MRIEDIDEDILKQMCVDHCFYKCDVYDVGVLGFVKGASYINL